MRFIFSTLFFSFLLISITAHADERYDGPRTVEAAKERFFKNRQLSNIEGIWYDQDEDAYYAITKNDNNTFRKWTISHKRPEYNGYSQYKDSIRKTANPNIFILKTGVYDIRNPNITAETTATIILEGNLISYQIKSFTDKKGIKWGNFNETNYIKVWPDLASIKNNTVASNAKEEVYFNGIKYTKDTLIDYKNPDNTKRTCINFESHKDRYYYCTSSYGVSYSKDFYEKTEFYDQDDLLRYRTRTSGFYTSSGYVVDKVSKYSYGVWFGRNNGKKYQGVYDGVNKEWLISKIDNQPTVTKEGTDFKNPEQYIEEANAVYKDSLKVKSDIEQLLAGQTASVNSSKQVNQNTSNNDVDLKSYWWVVVLIGVGAFFIYTQTTKELPKPKKIQKFKPKNQGAIGKFFEGDVSLATSFWGIYFGLGTAIGLIYYGLSENSDNDLIIVLSSLFIVSFTVFTMIGTWRSASKYKIDKKRKGDRGGWGTAAQVYIALGVIRMISQFIKAFG